MKKLSFVCSWTKDRKNSWSGTHNSLLNALSKIYDVTDINIRFTADKFFNKALRKLKVVKDDMYLASMQQADKLFSAEEGVPVFQFHEMPYAFSNRQYIYQDLSVGYVKKMHDELPEIFACSSFENVHAAEIDARERYQRNFYLSDNCAGIFTMGRWLARELVENYGLPASKVHCAGGGYNLNSSLIDDGHKEGNKFLFVGKDFKRKNGALVVEAFKLLKERHPEYELYIIGPANIHSHKNGIHFLGRMSFAEEVKYFNLCDVFVMPSIFEAYGIVFPEALTFGLPCIGRNAYEMPYFIEEDKTGYLLKKNCPQELALLMEKAINNKQMSETVKQKRAWYLKEYSWDTVAQRIASVIDKN